MARHPETNFPCQAIRCSATILTQERINFRIGLGAQLAFAGDETRLRGDLGGLCDGVIEELAGGNDFIDEPRVHRFLRPKQNRG